MQNYRFITHETMHSQARYANKKQESRYGLQVPQLPRPVDTTMFQSLADLQVKAKTNGRTPPEPGLWSSLPTASMFRIIQEEPQELNMIDDSPIGRGCCSKALSEEQALNPETALTLGDSSVPHQHPGYSCDDDLPPDADFGHAMEADDICQRLPSKMRPYSTPAQLLIAETSSYLLADDETLSVAFSPPLAHNSYFVL